MRSRHTEDSKNVRDNLDRTFMKISVIIKEYSYVLDVIGRIYFKM